MWIVILLLTFGLCSARVLEQDSSSETVEGGGFLSSELPLEIVLTTPSKLADNSTEPLEVEDQQALTVVYSRSVIALGRDFGTASLPNDKIPFFLEPEIPGRFRWVTTFVARWDPHERWPLDYEIKFTFNKNLTTHDGILLQSDGIVESVLLTTAALDVFIETVKSERAFNLTDDGWSPLNGVESDTLPEVPPDGVLEVSFNTKVSLTALQENWKVLDDSSKEPAEGLQIKVRPCVSQSDRSQSATPCLMCKVPSESKKSEEENDCVYVSIDGDLQMDTRYALFLGEGVQYSKTAGPLKANTNVTFGGLRKFRIPFPEETKWGSDTIATNWLRLWLPHGLKKTAESDIRALKQQFTISTSDGDEVDFDLELENNYTLRISTSLIPETNYTITVDSSSDILDGFGLPLEASSIKITAPGVGGDFWPFRTDYGYAIFEGGENWGRKIVAAFKGTPEITKCPKAPDVEANTVNVFQIAGADDIKGLLQYFKNSHLFSSTGLGTRNVGRPIGKIQQENEGAVELGEFDIAKYLDPTGLVAAEFCGDTIWSGNEEDVTLMLINESDMQAIVLGSENGRSIVWVTSMKTGKPIEGAKVTLYDLKKRLPKAQATNTTDGEGKAFFEGLSKADIVHVEFREKSLFVRRRIEPWSHVVHENKFLLVLDRTLVRPGETLYIKGYSRKRILETPAKVEISPPFDSEAPENEIFLPIDLDEKFGTFELEIAVPQNATNKEYSAAIRYENDTLAEEEFTVGEPRPPTAGLTVDAPFWAGPGSKVVVNITAETFIGASVGDAKITLEWFVSLLYDDEIDEDRQKAEVELVTDALGKASTEIDLGWLDKAFFVYRSLRVEVSWVGPTGELIEGRREILLSIADVDIDFYRSVSTHFPGQEFGVKVLLTDLKFEPLKKSRTLVLNLKKFLDPESDMYDVPAGSIAPLDLPIVDSCELQSNSEGYDCRFSLPELGFFALETCVEVAKNSEDKFCRITTLGRTAEEPIKQHLPVGLVSLTEGPHKVGDRLKFGIENPYKNAKALVVWGSPLGIDHMTIPINDSSLHEFSIDVGENCARGCELSVGVAVPRQTEGVATNPRKVPVDKMLDLAMPRAAALSTTIGVIQETRLDVQITFPDIQEDEAQDFVVSPGETTTIQVNITDPEIDEAEVTVVVVDKAILQLSPVWLRDLTEGLRFGNDFGFGFWNSGDDLVSPWAMGTLAQEFLKQKEIDPWSFSPNLLDPGRGYSANETTEEYVDSRSEFVTVDPHERVFRWGGRRSRTTRVGRIGRIWEETGSPSRVRVLEDFVSTPLFETVVAKDGIASINFTAPDNLGTFNIKAYVATGSGTAKYGSVEKELIVRRAISLTPSAPRFARVGDEFEAGAVVTVSGANPSDANVSIAIDLLNGLSLEVVGESKRAVKVGDDGTEEVRFRFKAKRMGEAKFKITADVGRSAGDALVINFPVEGLQEGVIISSSFAIDGNSSSQWQEGLQLPQAVPGSGAIAIQAGVGRMPAVLSMAGQIYDSNPNHKCPIDAGFALALVTIRFVTETYKVLDLEPSSLDQDTLKIIDGIQPNFKRGLKSLQEMTREGIGLDYVLNCKSNPRTFPTQPSLRTNARGVFLLRLLKEDLDALDKEVLKNGVPQLKSLNMNWTSALESVLIKKITRTASLALARAALGGDWIPPADTREQIVKDLSMDRLSEQFDSMGIESQAYYALARISMDGGERHPDVQKAIKSWTSNFRLIGRMVYIARSEGSSTPASNVANSLALMIMLKAKVENPLLGKLANFVSSPSEGEFGFRALSDFDRAVAMISLRGYDVDRGSSQPDVKLKVRSGESSLLDVHFTGDANPVASSSTPWEDLASPPEPLEFRANGTGEVTLAAALTFVPSKLLPFPTYRGIFVQRSIYIADSEDANKTSLKTIPVTSVVEVSVQITTPDRLGATTVRVLMPAGLEPLDPNIDDSEDRCPVPFAKFFERGSYFFFTCPDQETKPAVVTFRFKSMISGTQVVTFRAVAATAGTFALPPVKAFVNDQPDVMGLSPGGELEICSGKNCVAVEDASTKTPKSCPNDCSDNGACDLDSGSCLCFDGFKGDDCRGLEVA